MPIIPVHCLCCNTLCQGEIILGACYTPDIYLTEREAQLEIIDLIKTQIAEFEEGHRDFEETLETDWYVMPGDYDPDTKTVTLEGGTSVTLSDEAAAHTAKELKLPSPPQKGDVQAP